MRHRRKSDKFSRPRAQRRALIKSLVRALFISERITTTQRKARAASSKADTLINMAKKGSLHSRRLVYSCLESHTLVKKLFDDIAPRFSDTKGGYTRLINLGFRKGDGAKLALLELTHVKEKDKEKLKRKKESQKQEMPKEERKSSLKEAPKKSMLPKTGLRQSLKKIFKKERDAL